jgi:hypothetical protein
VTLATIAPGSRVETRHGGPYHVVRHSDGQLTLRSIREDGSLDLTGYATFVGVEQTPDGWRASPDVALEVFSPETGVASGGEQLGLFGGGL